MISLSATHFFAAMIAAALGLALIGVGWVAGYLLDPRRESRRRKAQPGPRILDSKSEDLKDKEAA